MFSDDPISLRYGMRKAAAFEAARRRAQAMLCRQGYPVTEVAEVAHVLTEKRILTTCATTFYKISKAVLDGRARIDGYDRESAAPPRSGVSLRSGMRWLTSLRGTTSRRASM